MELINTIFRLGVIFAIFGFIWMLIQVAITIISGGKSQSFFWNYTIKGLQYILLVQVTFLFCYESDSQLSLSQNSTLITALILLFYFVSKLQRNERMKVMFQFLRNGQPNRVSIFNRSAEIGLIVMSSLYFAMCIIYPWLAENQLSTWFKSSILSIESAAIFGFIFKVIGFFFLVSVFSKILRSILALFQPRTEANNNSLDGRKSSNDDHYDDFEDLTNK